MVNNFGLFISEVEKYIGYCQFLFSRSYLTIFGCTACGILVSQQGIELKLLQWKR